METGPASVILGQHHIWKEFQDQAACVWLGRTSQATDSEGWYDLFNVDIPQWDNQHHIRHAAYRLGAVLRINAKSHLNAWLFAL